MMLKRTPLVGLPRRKGKTSKVHCHFKSLWKSQDFSVSLRVGAVKSISAEHGSYFASTHS